MPFGRPIQKLPYMMKQLINFSRLQHDVKMSLPREFSYYRSWRSSERRIVLNTRNTTDG